MDSCKRVVATLWLLCLAALPAATQTRPQAGFDRLKALAGEWEGKSSDGQPLIVSYRIVSNGSVLQETLNVGKSETMVTMYHLDGDRLMVTHYCAAGNQPRMVASPDPNNPNVFSFEFLDVTNLASKDAGHMRNLVVTLVDKDHFTQQWSWSEKGKEERMELFKFTRRKS